ncbi:MAG TPA: YhcN/YlaJ family sporulation lipoprotein, partial [Chondromyces sp.]|nr:YhcN/YlaJ family sporulation lipoprotein [Chondromyces sp.]
MKKRWAPFVLATCLSTALVGCAGNQNDQAANDRNGNDNVQLTRVRTNNQNENNGNGTDHELRVSTRATRNIERMDEVDQANVIIRNNDAYVAVRLKNDDNGGNNNRNGNNNGNGG